MGQRERWADLSGPSRRLIGVALAAAAGLAVYAGVAWWLWADARARHQRLADDLYAAGVYGVLGDAGATAERYRRARATESPTAAILATAGALVFGVGVWIRWPDRRRSPGGR